MYMNSIAFPPNCVKLHYQNCNCKFIIYTIVVQCTVLLFEGVK